jgi:hypothetical protein
MKKIKWIANFLAVFSIMFAPLAQAKEVEKENLKFVREQVRSLGYSGPTKAKNMGEIWARARVKIPKESREKLDVAVGFFRNDPVPELKVESIDGSGKSDSVKVVMTLGGETITIELLDGSDQFAKINGTFFSEEELLGEIDASEKLLSIPYFRNAILKKKEELRTRSIAPTYEQYKAMNAIDWVHYRMHLAELLVANGSRSELKKSKKCGSGSDGRQNRKLCKNSGRGPRNSTSRQGRQAPNKTGLYTTNFWEIGDFSPRGKRRAEWWLRCPWLYF